jgi:hypothetical protein
MTHPVPESIRQKIWALYLKSYKPLSLDQIATQTGVSKSTAFNIVHEAEKEDPNYPLLRALVVNLSKDGSDCFQYAHVIRILACLREYGIDPFEAEKIIKKLLPALYRENWNPSDAIKILKKFDESSERFGKTRFEHSRYITNLIFQEQESRKRLAEYQRKTQSLIREHKIIQDNIDLFKDPHGLIRASAFQAMDGIRYKQKYEDLKRQMDSGKPIDPEKMKKLNEYMPEPVTEQQVLDKLEDIKNNPANYYELFQTPPAPYAAKKGDAMHPELFTEMPRSEQTVDPNANKNNGDAEL